MINLSCFNSEAVWAISFQNVIVFSFCGLCHCLQFNCDTMHYWDTNIDNFSKCQCLPKFCVKLWIKHITASKYTFRSQKSVCDWNLNHDWIYDQVYKSQVITNQNYEILFKSYHIWVDARYSNNKVGLFTGPNAYVLIGALNK